MTPSPRPRPYGPDSLACALGLEPAGRDDWRAETERTLQGRELADLIGATRDGIEIQPLYTAGPDRPAAAAAAVDPRRTQRGWDIRQRHLVADATADALQQEIDDDLSGGVTSVELDVASDVDVDADLLDRVLSGVDMAATPVALAPHADRVAAEALAAVAQRRGGALAAGSSLGLDPFGGGPEAERMDERGRRTRAVTLGFGRAERPVSAANEGGEDLAAAQQAHTDLRSVVADLAPLAGWAVSAGVRLFTVDAVGYADAGATEAQTLGWATATGVAYLRALDEAGLSVDAAAGLVGFRLPATADQFVTIAALRAARVMWSRVVTASGGSSEAARQYQHAVTAPHMYSRGDPWVNLLKGTAAALAAGVAGADAVTVLPLDHAPGPAGGDPSAPGPSSGLASDIDHTSEVADVDAAAPGSSSGSASDIDHTSEVADVDAVLGRRLARNTQLLMLEESHLARSSDPAGGSFYVESLTEQLAEAGWRVLQEVESSGGIAAAIGRGELEAALAESRCPAGTAARQW